MPTVFLADATKVTMGTQFDSRFRFLRQPTTAAIEGRICAGATLSINGNPPRAIPDIRFKMGEYTFDLSPQPEFLSDPTGTSVGITTS